MSTSYTEILKSDPLDLNPELSEPYYFIPLEAKSLLKVLNLLYTNKEFDIHEEILTFLQEEYSSDFPISYSTSQ